MPRWRPSPLQLAAAPPAPRLGVRRRLAAPTLAGRAWAPGGRGSVRVRTRRPLTAAAAIRVPWKGVFVAEYAGPLAVFPLALSAAGAVRGVEAGVPLALWTCHFSKRLFETLFVHSFSKSTMPLTNLFKNCGYYWGAACFVAWDVARHSRGVSWTFVLLFFVFEVLNGYCHRHLASLRSRGSKAIVAPTAWPFRFVSSPNYTFEVLSWISFACAFRSPASAVFAVAGAVQMAVWSTEKLKRYQRRFKDEPELIARHAMVPGVF